MCTYPESVGAEFDKINFQYIYPKKCLSIEEWMQNAENIRPYCVGAGEVAFYQLVLELNDIGKSFLMLDDFISNSHFYKLNKSLFK